VKEKISALMDGELERDESAAALRGLESGGEARETWRTYHLIGDAMREKRLLSAGFVERVSAAIDKEPTVLAPRRPVFANPAIMRWSALAAGVAAVALVGWVAFVPQGDQMPGAQVAGTVVLPKPPVQEASLVAPPEAANDYLLAHQGYSPRNSLQGAVPYVRVARER
jgi:sigma-E factor negative regulatory protein RseA